MRRRLDLILSDACSYGQALAAATAMLKELGAGSTDKHFAQAHEIRTAALKALNWPLWQRVEAKAALLRSPKSAAVF